jgi:D-3-phosphoglycerate dehydrogenase / 2-oxoglutarate reductase
MTRAIIINGRYPIAEVERLRTEFEVHHCLDPADLEALVADLGERATVVLALGATGLSGAQMRSLPYLKLVLIRGAGVDKVDLDTAASLGIAVASGQGTNAMSVADHALALTLALIRDVPAGIAGARGDWLAFRTSRPMRPLLWKKHVGILGLGDIGLLIARRLEGFDVAISYFNRKPRSDVPYRYQPSLLALAEASDVLIVTAPGGPATHHMVGEEVLKALGPAGYLVNVGRGSIVDTTALVIALRADTIAGAALDVIENEPMMTEDLLTAPRLIVTPHQGADSPEAVAAVGQRVIENLRAHFSGGAIAGLQTKNS